LCGIFHIGTRGRRCSRCGFLEKEEDDFVLNFNPGILRKGEAILKRPPEREDSTCFYIILSTLVFPDQLRLFFCDYILGVLRVCHQFALL
jgi:hypothetical protein